MTLLELVLTLIAVGVLLWLVNWIPFIDATIKKIITVLVVVVVVIWICQAIGLFGSLRAIRVG